MTLPSGQSVSYSYDALGRRASRTANGETTAFLYDGADVVVDRQNDATVAEYINGPGIDDKLKQTTASSSLYFLQDHLGSTIALTDSNGSIIERQQYEPFGNSTGSSLTRYGYTGREHDEATGLIYYRARWYDARQGRFITEDPIGMAGGLNLYSYVGNDPINSTDPLGLIGGPLHRPPGLEDSKLLDILEFFHEDDEFGVRYVDPLSGEGMGELGWGMEQAGDDPCAEWEWDAGVSEGGFVRGIGFLRKLLKWGSKGIKFAERLKWIAKLKAARGLAKINKLLMPGGKAIGQAGSKATIRELQGGISDAQSLFNQLSQGGKVISNTKYPGVLVRLPSGGTVGLRTVATRSPQTVVTIDVNIPNIPIMKIKFNP